MKETYITMARTDFNSWIHFDTQPIKEDKMKNQVGFNKHEYIIMEEPSRGARYEYLNADYSRDSAQRAIEQKQKKNPDSAYAMYRRVEVFEPTPEETIKDLEGKIYTISRGTITTKITAPCGETQSFSNDELRRLIDGTN